MTSGSKAVVACVCRAIKIFVCLSFSVFCLHAHADYRSELEQQSEYTNSSSFGGNSVIPEARLKFTFGRGIRRDNRNTSRFSLDLGVTKYAGEPAFESRYDFRALLGVSLQNDGSIQLAAGDSRYKLSSNSAVPSSNPSRRTTSERLWNTAAVIGVVVAVAAVVVVVDVTN